MKWFKYFMPFSFHSKTGEWVIKNDNESQTPVVILPEPQGGQLDVDGRNIYNKNNANLIAAAPEMLDALIDALSDVPYKIGKHKNPTWIKISTAIDKAQGRTK